MTKPTDPVVFARKCLVMGVMPDAGTLRVILDRLDAERARAESAEARLAAALAFVASFDKLVSAIEEAGEDGGCWDADPLWGPVIRARAALATSLHNPQRTGGEG